MSLSFHRVSIPVLSRALGNLSSILKKGEAFAEARKIDPSVLLNSRLAPDMFPLLRQVQTVSDTAKGCAARIAGVEIPSFADTEASFADLQDRLARTLAFVEGFTAAQIDGREDKPVILKMRTRDVAYTGQSYLCEFALPNLYFHVATAYAILRHNGVEIGKSDYLGPFPPAAG